MLFPLLAGIMACSGDGAGPDDPGEPLAIIEGRILLEGEGGLAGQRISVTRAPAFHQWAFTDDEGFYRLEVKSGLWIAEFATTRGYQDLGVDSIELYLLPGASVTLDPVTVARRVHGVSLEEVGLAPREFTVGVGAIVRWTILVPGVHNLGTAPVGDFWVSPNLAEWETYERIFAIPGESGEGIRCWLHNHGDQHMQFVHVVEGF